MIVTVFRRRLKEGETFDDFREAWEAEQGFGVPTRVFNAVRLDDDREVLTLAFVDADPATLGEAVPRVAAQEAVRHERIEQVVESTDLRAFYELRCEHDLTSRPREIARTSSESFLAALHPPQPSS